MKFLTLPLLLLFLACSSEQPEPCITAGEDQIERWQRLLTLEEAEGFSGSVLVAKGSEVLLSHEYGAAGRSTDPTAFWIASISKPMTAVAILQLVEEGKLALDAPISEYLGPVPDRWKDITVHHLLSHRSGLPHAYAADGVVERDQAVQAILALKPAREMGDFGYSNDGYTLLAVLVEVASGEPFSQFIQSHILEPAGMESAGLWGLEPTPSHVAALADPSQSRERPTTVWSDSRSVGNWGYRGATGIFATAKDLYRFASAVKEGRLLSKSSFSLMTSSKNPSSSGNGQTYGYGWALRLVDGQVAEFWHGGNEDWLGHNGLLKVSGDQITVILSNSGDLDSGSWSHRIEEGIEACADLR